MMWFESCSVVVSRTVGRQACRLRPLQSSLSSSPVLLQHHSFSKHMFNDDDFITSNRRKRKIVSIDKELQSEPKGMSENSEKSRDFDDGSRPDRHESSQNTEGSSSFRSRAQTASSSSQTTSGGVKPAVTGGGGGRIGDILRTHSVDVEEQARENIARQVRENDSWNKIFERMSVVCRKEDACVRMMSEWSLGTNFMLIIPCMGIAGIAMKVGLLPVIPELVLAHWMVNKGRNNRLFVGGPMINEKICQRLTNNYEFSNNLRLLKFSRAVPNPLSQNIRSSALQLMQPNQTSQSLQTNNEAFIQSQSRQRRFQDSIRYGLAYDFADIARRIVMIPLLTTVMYAGGLYQNVKESLVDADLNLFGASMDADPMFLKLIVLYSVSSYATTLVSPTLLTSMILPRLEAVYADKPPSFEWADAPRFNFDGQRIDFEGNVIEEQEYSLDSDELMEDQDEAEAKEEVRSAKVKSNKKGKRPKKKKDDFNLI